MLSESQRNTLKQLAHQSIQHGLATRTPLAVNQSEYHPQLQIQGACFVTLHKLQQLRGCIGSLEAYQPLVEDVATNAWSAAFRDPRFNPLTADEFGNLELEISVLSPPEHIVFSSEQDLLHKIRPGIDGLILQENAQRGTFLPSVWESLPTPEEFLQQLKQKAGLPADYWSENLLVSRYTTECF